MTARGDQPAKPYKDFPLYAHTNGQWAKKINGKKYYFGVWNDWKQALLNYEQVRDKLQTGRQVKTQTGILRELLNAFLIEQQEKIKRGQLAQRTFIDYKQTADRLIGYFGPILPLSDIGPAQFASYQSALPDTWTLRSIGREIRQVRTMFKFAADIELLPGVPNFGTFKPPKARDIRRKDQAKKAERGLLMFSQRDILSLVESLPVPWPAMILLGVNCGFGNTDCATLPLSAIDLETGWIDYARAKTATERRCPIWPETCERISEAIAKRKPPTNAEDADIAFLTKYGKRYVRIEKSPVDSISGPFSKTLKRTGIHRDGLNFYSLRRTFETIASETADQISVNQIMGHVDGSMAGVYRQRVADANLLAVSNHVRTWLFSKTPEECDP